MCATTLISLKVLTVSTTKPSVSDLVAFSATVRSFSGCRFMTEQEHAVYNPGLLCSSFSHQTGALVLWVAAPAQRVGREMPASVL